jgi:DNA polymerase III subunit epsilon
MLHDFTVFDFETTGVNPRTDQVVEMAAVRFVNGQEITRFSTLVRLRPRQYYDVKAQEVNGLTPEHLVHGMDEAAAFRHLRNMVRGSLLVAHNALFDLEFFDAALDRFRAPALTESFLCTLTVCRNRKPEGHYDPEKKKNSHKLTAMCAAYDVPLGNAHRALDDVLMTADLVRRLQRQGDMGHYVNVAGYDGRFKAPTWCPLNGRVVKQTVKSASKSYKRAAL